MKLNDIFADSIRKEVKQLISKVKDLKSTKPNMFPNKGDTLDHGYRSGSSKRFGQG